MKKVFVDFSSGSVRFESEGQVSREELVHGIEGLGYHVASDDEKRKTSFFHWLRPVQNKFYFCLLFTVPLLLHMILPWPVLHDPWIQLLLCLPVYTTGIFYFGRSALGSLKEGVPNMDVLIMIGSSAAFFYSLIGGIFLHNNDYLFFETSATIITLVLLGNLIEKKSIVRTRAAVESLAALQPQKAKRIDFFGNEKFEVITEIDHHEIKNGDYFLVNTGDRIPADGQIVWGGGWIDESMISGENMPVEKRLSGPVITGTVLTNGSIKMQATAVGKQTVLSQIIDMVNDAQRNRPHIQKLADKVTAVFVPVVLAISALTFVVAFLVIHVSFQQALMNSIGVLVISCPCAMGLATPTAVMVGIGRAARLGILIKGAQTLETFASVKTIVFDKTGTLTTGIFKIHRIASIGITDEELKKILVSTEKYSSHPIARSICDELSDVRSFAVQEIVEQKGISIQGKDEVGNIYEVGSERIFTDKTEGAWNVFVKKNGIMAGIAEVTDEVRAEAKPMVDFLKSAGIKTVMLSGDKKENCRRVAETLGIDEYHFEKLPDQKRSIIKSLRDQGTVAMVGDGINDAPALAAATVGVSLSHATQVAIDAAEIILLQNNLLLLVQAIKISRSTLKTIRQNLFWAFFYNSLAIPVAAVGLLRPIVAALSMAFSDVIVIGNSLRLRTRRLR